MELTREGISDRLRRVKKNQCGLEGLRRVIETSNGAAIEEVSKYSQQQQKALMALCVNLVADNLEDVKIIDDELAGVKGNRGGD